MPKYRKVSHVIEAFKFDASDYPPSYPGWLTRAMHEGTVRVNPKTSMTEAQLAIETLEGTMVANSGDYIIQGIEGEIYPCKASVFEKSYEKVD